MGLLFRAISLYEQITFFLNYFFDITEILCCFIISHIIFKFMEKTPKVHGFVCFRKDKLSILYDDLTDAIKENNTKSVWELSKVITRQHFAEREE